MLRDILKLSDQVDALETGCAKRTAKDPAITDILEDQERQQAQLDTLLKAFEPIQQVVQDVATLL